jgi:DNA polymerase-3 subunit gamma/tau
VKFIFATTEPHKLPDTILSRCQRHNFRRISMAAMLKRLQEICALEKVNVSGSALSLIVRQSEGGMRDALSLLDQVISACGLTPSDADVAEALGAIDRNVIHAFAVALVKRDAKSLLANVEELWTRGVDLRRLAEDLAQQLRHVFVAKVTGQAPDELADSDREAVLALAREADAAQVARLFDVVHTAVWEIARAPQPKLALEMALLKGLHLAPAGSLPDLIARVEKLAGTSSTTGAPGGRSAPATFRT